MSDTTVNRPFVEEAEPGRYAWCSCGFSGNQPHCDGAHKHNDTDKRPQIVEIDEGKRVAWCGCKKTATPPYCDGSHAR